MKLGPFKFIEVYGYVGAATIAICVNAAQFILNPKCSLANIASNVGSDLLNLTVVSVALFGAARLADPLFDQIIGPLPSKDQAQAPVTDENQAPAILHQGPRTSARLAAKTRVKYSGMDEEYKSPRCRRK